MSKNNISKEERQMIDEFIAEKGVNKLPDGYGFADLMRQPSGEFVKWEIKTQEQIHASKEKKPEAAKGAWRNRGYGCKNSAYIAEKIKRHSEKVEAMREMFRKNPTREGLARVAEVFGYGIDDVKSKVGDELYKLYMSEDPGYWTKGMWDALQRLRALENGGTAREARTYPHVMCYFLARGLVTYQYADVGGTIWTLTKDGKKFADGSRPELYSNSVKARRRAAKKAGE